MDYIQNFQFFLFPFFIIFFIFICLKFTSYSKTKKRLPPSPWKLPIIGNLHQLGSSPHRSLHALSEKHGPLMLLHLGGVPTLVASSSEAAREIMKTHDLSFSSRPSLTMPNILLYASKNIAFAPYGEHWRRLKSIVVVHLLSNARVKSYRQVREEEMGLMIDVLKESRGCSIDLGALIVSLANNIICRVAFGRTYGSPFTKLLRKLLDLLGVFNVGSFISWLSWVDRMNGLEASAKKIAKEFDEFLEGAIQEHENKRRGEDVRSDENQDLVDILLDVERDNTTGFTLHTDAMKGVILDIFGGGTDTIFTSLEWAMSELVRHPRVMKKLQQEVTEIAQGRSRSMILEKDLEKMQYLKAVIKESLRLHAPIPLLLPRESTQDVKLMGLYDIPAGVQVIINAWAIGRDPTLWEESTEFRPERFLENNIVDYKGNHFEWLPFGGGRRGCPGIQFGVAVMELVIANVVYKFDLGLPNGIENEDLDMSETYGTTMNRKSPLLVIANPRSS